MLFSLLWLGCDSSVVVGDNDKAPGTTETGDPDDTGIENIDDSGDDTAEDTGEDTGEDVETTTLNWNVDGDWAGTHFGLVHLEPPVSEDVGYTMGTVEWLAPAADSITLEVEAPRTELLTTIPELPGLGVAFFAGGLFMDDGDETWDADEGWVGVSLEWSIYLDGVLPPDLLAAGLREGWNAINLTAGEPQAGALDAMSIALAYRESITFSGTADDTIAATDRVAMLPGSIFGGAFPASLFGDVALSDAKTWTIELNGPPDWDHFIDTDGDGTEEAFEIPYAYTDADASGGISGDDPGLGVGCIDGAAVIGWWIEPPTNIVDLFSFASYGASIGWNVLVMGDEGPTDILDHATDVVLSTTCQLPE